MKVYFSACVFRAAAMRSKEDKVPTTESKDNYINVSVMSWQTDEARRLACNM